MLDPVEIATPTQTVQRPAIGYGNFTASVAPTVNDDESEGYSVNSHWYKSVDPDGLWICVDNTEGAAIWREISLTVEVTYLVDENGDYLIDENGFYLTE